MNKSLVSICLCIIALCTSYGICFAVEEDKTERLVKTATEKKLHEKRQWQTLLHYKPNIVTGFESLVDDPAFFNSKTGKVDPESELRETLLSFFITNSLDDSHPQCRFPLRLKWVKKELEIPDGQLPKPDCAKLKEFIELVRPKSVALIFPTTYLNNPASIFGHTFLRFDSDTKSKLISTGINYAAITHEPPGLFYAFKGIFGMYKGYLSMSPYYGKINEYNNLENRDIWEYPLMLNESETGDMLLHIWELNMIYSDYYFFDENCSYFLLFLIEAVRPDVNLTDRFIYWVIPVDTLRVLGESGLLGNPVYRPSRSRTLRVLEKRISKAHLTLARDVALGTTSPEAVSNSSNMSDNEKSLVLTTASEFLQYHYLKSKKMDKNVFSKRYINILDYKSKLPDVEVIVPTPAPPERGHKTAKVEVGAGAGINGMFMSIDFCPACHDPADPSAGYEPGLSISFLDTEIRYTPSNGSLALQELKVLKIMSLTPYDFLLKTHSWQLDTGFGRDEVKGLTRDVYRFVLGGGESIIVANGTIAYAFARPGVLVGDTGARRFTLGVGVSAGVISGAKGFWTGQFEANWMTYFIGDVFNESGVFLNQNFAITNNDSIKLKAGIKRIGGHEGAEAVLYYDKRFY